MCWTGTIARDAVVVAGIMRRAVLVGNLPGGVAGGLFLPEKNYMETIKGNSMCRFILRYLYFYPKLIERFSKFMIVAIFVKKSIPKIPLISKP